DFTCTCRAIARRPVGFLSGLCVLGLGVSVVASLLILVDAVFLAPAPYARADTLFSVGAIQPGDVLRNAILSLGDIQRLRPSDEVESATGFTVTRSSMAPSGIATEEGVLVAEVDPGYFLTLGTAPLYGRVLSAADASGAAPTPTVVSYRCWRDRFGGDPTVI